MFIQPFRHRQKVFIELVSQLLDKDNQFFCRFLTYLRSFLELALVKYF